MGRDGDVGIDGITTTVVSVAAKLNPHNESEQPIMQLVDTAIGIAVGLGASWAALQLARRLPGIEACSSAR